MESIFLLRLTREEVSLYNLVWGSRINHYSLIYLICISNKNQNILFAGRLSSKKEGESCGLGGAHSGLPPMDHPPIGWGAMGRSLGEVFGVCGPDLTCEPSKDEDKPGTCVKTGRLSLFRLRVIRIEKCSSLVN